MWAQKTFGLYKIFWIHQRNIGKTSNNNIGINSLFIDSFLKENLWTHLFIDINLTSYF